MRASYEPTTCSCWRHWTPSSQDLWNNCTRSTFSVKWKETTSRLRRRRSERTRSYCQHSVASLLNSSSCFLMHSTTVDSSVSVMLSLNEKVCALNACTQHIDLDSVLKVEKKEVHGRTNPSSHRSPSPSSTGGFFRLPNWAAYSFPFYSLPPFSPFLSPSLSIPPSP